MSQDLLASLGIHETQFGCAIGGEWRKTSGAPISARSPIDGAQLGVVASATMQDVNSAVDAAHEAFLKWRVVPAPRRGELVRRFGEKLRARKNDSRGALAASSCCRSSRNMRE